MATNTENIEKATQIEQLIFLIEQTAKKITLLSGSTMPVIKCMVNLGSKLPQPPDPKKATHLKVIDPPPLGQGRPQRKVRKPMFKVVG